MYILQITYIFVFVIMLLMYFNVVFSNTSEISKKLLIFLTAGLVLSLTCILQVFAKTTVEDRFYLNISNATFIIATYAEIRFAYEFNNLKMKKGTLVALFTVASLFLFLMLTNNAHELVYGYKEVVKGNEIRSVVYAKPLYYCSIAFLYSKIFVNFYAVTKNKKGVYSKKDLYFLARTIFCGLVYTIIISDFEDLRMKYNILAVLMVLDSATLFYISHQFELKLDINKTKLYIVENIDMPIIVIMDGGKIIKHNIKATELFKSLDNSEMMNVYDLEEIVKEENVDLKEAKTLKIRVNENEEKFFNVSIKEIKASFFSTYYLVVLEDATTIKMAEQKLEILTSLDALTNVNNRESLTNLAVATLEDEANVDLFKGVFMLDLDYFKKVNDTFGHIIGDEFLISTSGILREVIEPFGHVGRYGGEEFCGVLTCSNIEELENKLNQLRINISENYVKVDEDNYKNVTVSIGYAIYSDDNRDVGLLFKQADEALYEAKNGGRNRVVGYSVDSVQK